MQDIIIRGFDFHKDYPEICEWWRANGWPNIPKSHLPPTGLVAHVGDVKLCAVWFYITQSAFGWLEWCVTNPKAPLRLRTSALSDTIDSVLNLSKQAGSETIFSSLKSKGLIRLLTKKGFKVADLNMTNLVLTKE